MSVDELPIDPSNLKEAFALFTEASQQLSTAYAELQQQVISLTEQLEVANGNLRREFEEKSALSRRLRLLLDRLPAGVLELNSKGEILTQNLAAQRLLLLSVSETSWSKIVAERMQKTAEPGVWSYQCTQGMRQFLLEEVDVPEESVRLVLLHDVTAAHEMRRAFARHERLAAMGEMAAGLAHQLRTPLSTVLLYNGHLCKPDLDPLDRQRFAQKSVERLRHLETLIQNMLRFVRGQHQLTELIDLNCVLQDAIQHVQPQFDLKSISLFVSELPEPVMIQVNAREFAACLVNIFENALQASKSGSKVICNIQLVHSTVNIQVTDEGEGMTPQVLERLFEPFFTTRKEGTGLGLAIVRNLIASYGGDISVDSSLDLGSCFNICLPVATAATKV